MSQSQQKGSGGNQEETEMKQLAKAELARLQRQYRVMEGDRSTYTAEMRVYLARQRKIIDVLVRRKKNLTADMAVRPARRVALAETSAIKETERKLEKLGWLTEKIKSEKTQLSELKIQKGKIEDEILKLNKTDVNELRVQEKKEEYKRMIKALEDRLEVAAKKLNSVVADNAVHRHEITHLLHERRNFHKFYTRMSKQLLRSKQTMIDLVEQATSAFDQREETQGKLKGLKERAKEERARHALEVRELVRRLENDQALYEFLSVKGQRRLLADLEAKEAQRRKQREEEAERRVAEYNATLERIRAFSGESDVGRLAVRFLKQEEENFTLFSYVNELNGELEALQEHVNRLMLAVDEQRGVNRERAAQQKEALTLLEDNLQKEKMAVANAESDLSRLDSVLNALMIGIEGIFYQCQCHSAPVLALVGQEPRVNIYNVMLCIAVLEKYSVHLLARLGFEQDSAE